MIKIKNENGGCAFLIRMDLMFSMSYVFNVICFCVRFWLLIPEMNASRKAMEWLICFSILNLMFFYRKFNVNGLFKEFKKFNESCSLSKAAKMSTTYLKQNLGLLRLCSFSHLDSQKPMKILARTEAKGEPVAALIVNLTVKNRVSLWCSKKEKFFKFFYSDA